MSPRPAVRRGLTRTEAPFGSSAELGKMRSMAECWCDEVPSELLGQNIQSDIRLATVVDDEQIDEAEETATYTCVECGARWEDRYVPAPGVPVGVRRLR